MDVPNEVLAELKCNECETYLSRGPVYLEHGGAAACGRCFSPRSTRNKQYEAVAKLLRFPCKNKDLGCKEIVDFVAEDEEVGHEATCEYWQYVCPVLGSSRCAWLGTRSQILQHCQRQHPDHVLDNPCSLAHDITTSSLHNYVLQAYELIFLLLTQVCVTSGKIYHSVRLLDAGDLAKDFTYTLNIKRNNAGIVNTGDVAPQGCLALQEPTALVVDINSLLSVLCGWGGVSCTVAVERRWREKCSRCEAEVTVKLYRDARGWRCESCVPTRRVCRNQARGCTHQDIPDKCEKHEAYFCKKSTRCWICEKRVSRGKLFAHYTSRHQDVTHGAGSTWRVTPGAGSTWRVTPGCPQWCLMTCPAGTAVCWCWWRDSRFDLQVYIPVLSGRLCEFRCETRVTQPSTGRTHTYTPNVRYNAYYDWCIDISEQDFPSFTGEFDICVIISKI